MKDESMKKVANGMSRAHGAAILRFAAVVAAAAVATTSSAELVPVFPATS